MAEESGHDQLAGTPLNRRHFLRSAGAGLLGAAVAAETLTGAAGAADEGHLTPLPEVAAGDGLVAAVPFYGEHQAGIVNPKPPAGLFAAFDVTAGNRSDLMALFKELTAQSAQLTAGGAIPSLGVGQPPADSGILGPVPPPDGLTITVSVGASLFDERFGLTEDKPKHLSTMEAFPNDNLDQAQCHGDLMLQVCAGSADTAVHAVRFLAKHTRGAMQARYRLDGFNPPPRPTGAPRNLLGFNDGIANPQINEAAVANQLLWAGADEPAWAGGGSYHVVRLIRMFIEFWDRVSIEEQENMIGRRRDSGAPLSGDSADDIPEYANDPRGSVIPLSAHIRLSNPRTKATEENQILRRGYNYDRGLDENGNLDMGLIFSCFQQNLDRQFKTVQTRLINEPMVDYISPFGGGYFFALPGVRDQSDFYARSLLT
jgi:deferrochelatase/peroxidase EfeB